MANYEGLKSVLIQEHKRDKRLTIINYGVILIVVLFFVGVIVWLIKASGGNVTTALFNAFNTEYGSAPEWARYIFIVFIIGFILYPFFRVWRLNKRTEEIDRLIASLETGGKATSVSDYKEYKITIPLGKIHLKLSPVTFLTITLSNDKKLFQLPIRKHYISEVKLILSQANLGKLHEIKDVLYSGELVEPTEEESVHTPLKSLDEFKTFISENLQSTLDTVDKQRKSARKSIMTLMPIILLVVFGIAGYYVYNSFNAAKAGDYSSPDLIKQILPFFVLVIVLVFGYSYVIRRKYAQKTDVQNGTPTAGTGLNELIFGKIVKFINPTVEYIPLGHVGLSEFLENGWFDEKNYDIGGNDQISGWHNGVPFISCELWVTYTPNWSDEKTAPDSVFAGQFFVARFNKTFSSAVYIKPKLGLKGNFTNNNIGSYLQSSGEKVQLEDPEFMELFEVYADDQVEARYILTTSLMEKIKELSKRTKGQYYISFKNNKITVLNNNQDSNYKLGYFSSLTKNDNKLIIDYYENIGNQFAVIDDLKLNIKIWK